MEIKPAQTYKSLIVYQKAQENTIALFLYYKKDYRRFLSVARGSSLELEYWANLLIEVRPQDKDFLESILPRNTEVVRILSTLMKKFES